MLHFNCFILIVITNSLAFGQDPVKELIDQAQAEFASENFEQGAQTLYEACVQREQIGSLSHERLIADLAKEHDPRMELRRKTAREIGAAFYGEAQKFLQGGLPSMAEWMFQRSEMFDHATPQTLLDKIKSLKDKIDNDPELKKYDSSALFTFQIIENMGFASVNKKDSPKTKSLKAQLGKKMESFLKVHQDAVKKTFTVAKAYQKANWFETADLLLKQILELGPSYQGKLRKDILKMNEDIREARAKKRYEDLAKPHMLDLKKSHIKAGGDKGWKFKGIEILAPKPGALYSLLVSKKKLGSEYSIEVDVQYPNRRGYCCLVFAFHDKHNFLSLEIEQFKSYTTLRFCQHKNNKKKVIEEIKSGPSMQVWRTFMIDVNNQTLRVRCGRTQFKADIPKDHGPEGGYGFLRPKHPFETKKKIKGYEARFRNLVVTEE